MTGSGAPGSRRPADDRRRSSRPASRQPGFGTAGADRPAAHRLTLRHDRGETGIRIAAGALAGTAAELEPWLAGRAVFVITSRPVHELHGRALEPLGRPAARWQLLEVPDGEAAKTPEVAGGLWERLLAAGGKRDSRVLAFGGGTVGDLAGFVAGGFLRGVEYAQLPTTLLAQVDAAIGGKTGVNLPAGKNTVGLFHHPRWVVADTSLLATLPVAERRSGLVEAIKMGAVLDRGLFERLESAAETLLGPDPGALAEAAAPLVAAAVAAKVAVVERDPREGGERRLLNFGHTLGHALESAAGYRGLLHGDAVAYGMLFALRLATETAAGPASELADRLPALLARLGLPPLPAVNAQDLLKLMRGDKKSREGGLAWVLPGSLGSGRVVEAVPEDRVRRELERFLVDPWG